MSNDQISGQPSGGIKSNQQSWKDDEIKLCLDVDLDDRLLNKIVANVKSHTIKVTTSPLSVYHSGSLRSFLNITDSSLINKNSRLDREPMVYLSYGRVSYEGCQEFKPTVISVLNTKRLNIEIDGSGIPFEVKKSEIQQFDNFELNLNYSEKLRLPTTICLNSGVVSKKSIVFPFDTGFLRVYEEFKHKVSSFSLLKNYALYEFSLDFIPIKCNSLIEIIHGNIKRYIMAEKVSFKSTLMTSIRKIHKQSFKDPTSHLGKIISLYGFRDLPEFRRSIIQTIEVIDPKEIDLKQSIYTEGLYVGIESCDLQSFDYFFRFRESCTSKERKDAYKQSFVSSYWSRLSEGSPYWQIHNDAINQLLAEMN